MMSRVRARMTRRDEKDDYLRKGLLDQIEPLVKEYFAQTKQNPENLRVPLSVPGFGWQEVLEALDSLLSTRVTMGDKVRQFERAFASYVGMEHGIMVNSGSSANLVALSVLASPNLGRRIQPGDEVITTPVTWSTTVFPILQIGAVPVFVDVDLETYGLDLDRVEKAITPKTRAVMPVHLLGNPVDMPRLMKIADRHDLYIIEDSCEAHGAEVAGQKVGSFGHLSTFSFYFSHHITCVEGGIVLTNDPVLADLARSIRAHGWIREMETGEGIARKYPDLDRRFLFYDLGYNLRPMEIQGAFGIHQMGRLEPFIEIRRRNAAFWTQCLAGYGSWLLLHQERPGTRHSWFGYPITVLPQAPFSRGELVGYLEERGIETRPLMSGNFLEHPVMAHYTNRVYGELTNAQLVHQRSFLVGNHHGIGEEEMQYVAGELSAFLARYK